MNENIKLIDYEKKYIDFFIRYSKQNNSVNILCNGVLVNNKMSIENTIKKYDFRVIDIQQICAKNVVVPPCQFTNVIFVKDFKKNGN